MRAPTDDLTYDLSPLDPRSGGRPRAPHRSVQKLGLVVPIEDRDQGIAE